jgi:hypothetical protein
MGEVPLNTRSSWSRDGADSSELSVSEPRGSDTERSDAGGLRSRSSPSLIDLGLETDAVHLRLQVHDLLLERVPSRLCVAGTSERVCERAMDVCVCVCERER